MTNVKHSYETIMVFNVQSGEEGVKALVERFKGLIAENSVIDSEEDWGKRRLAYPIEDEIEGYYYKVNFTCDPDFPAELDRVYKITDGVLRTLIVRLEKPEEAKEEVKAPEAKAAEPVVEAATESTEA